MEFDPLAKFAPVWARFLLAFFVLGGMAWADYKKNGANATRYKEYLFLAVSTIAAVGFAEVHDAITVRISPAYFAVGKGLGWDGLHWNVMKLAVKGSYWMGLLLGLFFLIANNPFNGWPRLSYGRLYSLVWVPVVCASIFAVFFGLWYRSTAQEYDPSFALVWGIHTGTYLGALLGAIAATLAIIVLRMRILKSGRQ